MPLIATLKRNIFLIAIGFAVLAVSAAGMSVTVRGSNTTSAGRSASTGAVIEHATAETFEKRVLRSRGLVLVDFYADWCGPCRTQGAILKEFAPEFHKGKIVKIDVDKSPKLAVRYGVQGLPTLLVFKDGKVIGQHVGLISKKQLQVVLSK